jgi:hypothetical protein
MPNHLALDGTVANMNKSKFLSGAAAVPELLAAHAICAFTVREFCTAHRISLAFYYVMKSEGWGPREMRAGSRVMVSREAAEDWRRAREIAATTTSKRKLETAA